MQKQEVKDKIILGIHIGHDRGACIIRNAKVLGMIAQERLDRIKYSRSYSLPFEAINSLLDYCKVDIIQIDCIGISCDAIEGDSLLELIQEEFENYYKIAIPFFMVSHHDAHAYAAYYSSGMNESLILVADGGGDYVGDMVEAESLYLGKAGKIKKIAQRLQAPTIRHLRDTTNYIYPLMPSVVKKAPISIARKYEQITYLLGFGWGEAGKTMGLASYGKPVFTTKLPSITDFDYNLTYADLLDDIFIQQSLSDLPFYSFIQQNKADIASSVQYLTQKTIIALVNMLFMRYHCKNICLSGGLFLNCLSNQEIIEQSHPDNIFILPCAGDDGQALGCAYYAYIHYLKPIQRFDIQLPYLGLSYKNEKIEEALISKGLDYAYLEDKKLAKKVSQLIANNKIIGLHRGRTEVGPRALCHRSILANPANPEMKDILNRRVKHREEFRPFAPSVIAEEQNIYFDLPISSDFMLLATDVYEQYRGKLASVTHVDGTARVQAIRQEQDPFIHFMLTCLKKDIGVPIVLNTSFNVAGEPIVESPEDAINTYLKTEIDILVIGNYIIENKDIKI